MDTAEQYVERAEAALEAADDVFGWPKGAQHIARAAVLVDLARLAYETQKDT